MRRTFAAGVLFIALLGLAVGAQAKGGGGHSSSHSSASPGTGAKSQSVQVRGYTRKDGTYVAPSRRSAPDKSFTNNWSTKGNTNPVTGKAGTKVERPQKR